MMASTRVLGENSFLSQIERVRVDLKEKVARAHQVLQERETALLSELLQLEDTYRGEGVAEHILDLSLWNRQIISDPQRNQNKELFEQSVAQLSAGMRELEANLETARDRMRRVELEWDGNLEGILSRTGSILVRGVWDNNKKGNTVWEAGKHIQIANNCESSTYKNDHSLFPVIFIENRNSQLTNNVKGNFEEFHIPFSENDQMYSTEPTSSPTSSLEYESALSSPVPSFYGGSDLNQSFTQSIPSETKKQIHNPPNSTSKTSTNSSDINTNNTNLLPGHTTKHQTTRNIVEGNPNRDLNISCYVSHVIQCGMEKFWNSFSGSPANLCDSHIYSTSENNNINPTIPSSGLITSFQEPNQSFNTTNMGGHQSKYQSRQSTIFISEDKPCRGLKNLGSTCYMNCILQCLSHTLPLRQFYVTDEYKQYLNDKRGALSNAFRHVMAELWSTTYSDSVVPYDLKREMEIVTPKFSDYNQHDAHEFMRFILDELHEEINRASVEGRKSPADNETLGKACARYLTWEDSRISELFSGMLRSEVCCSICSNQSIVYIPFMDIALPIPERIKRPYRIYSNSSYPTVHVSDCFTMFTREETLNGEESPFCNKCINITKSTKQLSIAELPKFLVIQLKKFSNYPKRKKSIHVEFDGTWSLNDSANDTHTYSLYGIVCHLGSISGGHYVAYCNYSGIWTCFDDSIVRIVGWEEVKNQEAYILFYQR